MLVESCAKAVEASRLGAEEAQTAAAEAEMVKSEKQHGSKLSKKALIALVTTKLSTQAKMDKNGPQQKKVLEAHAAYGTKVVSGEWLLAD